MIIFLPVGHYWAFASELRFLHPMCQIELTHFDLLGGSKTMGFFSFVLSLCGCCYHLSTNSNQK
jgi:hypothetical protein